MEPEKGSDVVGIHTGQGPKSRLYRLIRIHQVILTSESNLVHTSCNVLIVAVQKSLSLSDG